jgi:flagellar assembly protein FliH
MAGIIKVGRTSPTLQGATAAAYQFDDMQDAYLARVRGEAAKIIADARDEAARLKKQATEEGKQTALKAVEASLRGRAEEKLQSVLQAISQAAAEIGRARDTWQKQWEEQAIRLAVAIAERIIRREIATNPQITLELLRETLQLAAGSPQLTIRLHPQDCETLGAQADSLAKRLAGLATVEVVPDATLTPGGCRIETAQGSIDASLETQLERITNELTD